MKLSDFRSFEWSRAGNSPLGVKLAFAIFLFALIVGVGWYWQINPKREDLRRHVAEEVDLLEEFEFKQGRVVNLEAYKLQLEDMKEMLRASLRQLPSKTEMPDLLIDISQTALSTGIDNQKFEPGPEELKEFYAEKPINLRMVGTYHQFGSFVSGVAALRRVVILTMHDISLTPQASTNPRDGVPIAGLLRLEGTMKTYRYVDEDEAAATEAAATADQAAGGS